MAAMYLKKPNTPNKPAETWNKIFHKQSNSKSHGFFPLNGFILYRFAPFSLLHPFALRGVGCGFLFSNAPFGGFIWRWFEG